MSTENHNEFKLDSYNRRGVKRLGQSQTQALSAWGAWEENTPRTFHYKIANAELLAICSMVEKELEAVGKEMSLKYRTKDFMEIIKNEDLGAVAIASSSQQHCRMLCAAAEAGRKKIYIEKPLGMTIEEIGQINVAGMSPAVGAAGNRCDSRLLGRRCDEPSSRCSRF